MNNIEKAKKYDKLLEQTRDDCTECKGTGLNKERYLRGKCKSCRGVGFIYHPERIVVLDSDQSINLSSLENSASTIPIHFRTAQLMLKANFKRVKESEK